MLSHQKGTRDRLLNRNFKRVLVIQTAFLGDVILITPLLRALNIILPNARLEVLLIPETSAVLKYNPYLSDILEFNKRKLRNKIVSFFRLIFEIQKRQYDLAISVQSSLTSALLMVLGRIPIRLGFSRQKLLTHSVPHVSGMHKIQKVLRLIEPFTTQKFDMQTELHWSSAEDARADEIMAPLRERHRPIIGIAPGSIWYTKRWLKQYYAELIKRLERAHIQSVLIGGKEDKELCDFIRAGTNAVNLAGSLTVLESAALIKRCDLMVTNDSAPLHIANAVKTDVIAIFGPTVTDFGFYPFRKNDQVIEIELDCRPCSSHGGKKCPLKHHRCMKDISPEMVFNAVIAKLQDKEFSRS